MSQKEREEKRRAIFKAEMEKYAEQLKVFTLQPIARAVREAMRFITRSKD
jgi:hypothetical protein